MDVLLLGIDPTMKKFLREQIAPTTPSKPRFYSPPLDHGSVPVTGRWDLVVLDRKVKAHGELAEAIKTNQVEGLKIVLTERENLHSAIEFWGTGIYSYLLKPINRELFRLVWQNALERIQLAKEVSRLQQQKKKQRTMSVEHQDILQDLFVAHLKMQELEEAKTGFLVRTAHELRSPLTALKGYLDLLANGKAGTVNELQREMLINSMHSCRRLLRLAHSLLDLSALGGYRAHLKLERGDVSECLHRAMEEVRPATEAKGLELKMTLEADLPPLRFDFDRMQQVMVNLLENAVKFTLPGGTVRLRCGPYFWDRRTVKEMIPTAPERRQEGRSTPGNSVRIVVEDTGVGIAPELLPDIFEEYFRGTNGEGSPKGFGLGLAVARQIVAAHDGTIGAESQLGCGSCFTVVIPAGL